jgi:hypothetical protein
MYIIGSEVGLSTDVTDWMPKLFLQMNLPAVRTLFQFAAFPTTVATILLGLAVVNKILFAV